MRMPVFYRIVFALYQAVCIAMVLCVLGGIIHYLSERQEAHREAQAQAREYNKSIREMERILLQMQKQRASADYEFRNH